MQSNATTGMAGTDGGSAVANPSTRTATETGTMTVVVTVQHPAHVHFYKHAIAALEATGHRVEVFVVDKDVATDLLDAYDIEYEVIGARGPLYSLPARQAAYEYRLWKRVRRIDPDVMTAIGGVAVSHVARLVGARSVVFTDTEHATISNTIAFPFADAVYTPEWYEGDHGTAQVRYPGCHELAYLHPDRFEPDPAVVQEVGVDPHEPYVVFRHGGWGAVHDVGDGGLADVVEVVDRLEAAGATVLLTSEDDHPPAVADRAVDVDPTRMHDLLAFADLFVGESGTMSIEAGVLGTPAIYVHTARPGIITHLAAAGLVFPFHGEHRHRNGVRKGIELLNADLDWAGRRRVFLEDVVDTTELVLDAIVRPDAVDDRTG